MEDSNLPKPMKCVNCGGGAMGYYFRGVKYYPRYYIIDIDRKLVLCDYCYNHTEESRNWRT